MAAAPPPLPAPQVVELTEGEATSAKEGSNGETKEFSVTDLIMPVYLPSLLIGLTRSMTALMLTNIAKVELGLGSDAVGAAHSAYWLGKFSGNMPSGLFVGAYGVKTGNCVSLLLSIVGLLTVAMAPSQPLLWAGQFVAGLGICMWLLGRQVFIAATVPRSHRGRAISFITLQRRASLFAGPILGAASISVAGSTRGAGVAAAGVAAAALAVVLLGTPSGSSIGRTSIVQSTGAATPGPSQATAGPSQATSARARTQCSYGFIFRNHWRSLLRAGGYTFCMMAVRANYAVMITLMAHKMAMAPAVTGMALAMQSASDVLLFPLAGWLLDRLGRRAVGAASPAAIGLALLALSTASTQAQLVACVLLLGCGNGLANGVGMTLATDLAPREARAEFTGAFRMFNDAGAVLGPLLIGWVAESKGLPAAVVVVAAIAFAAAAWMIVVVPDTSSSKEADASQKPQAPAPAPAPAPASSSSSKETV